MAEKSKRIDWNHPFITRYGLVPDYLIWEILDVTEDYRRRLLRRHKIKPKQLGKVKWFTDEQVRTLFAEIG